MGVSHSACRGAQGSRRLVALALCAASFTVGAADASLHPPEGSVSGHSPSEYALARTHVPVNSVSVLGNYYLFDPTQSDLTPTLSSLVGGFRLSTGVYGLSHTTNLFDGRPGSNQNLPYIGLGYSRLWFNSQLSLNADFGLASQNNGAGLWHMRGLSGGVQTLDEAAGELRWAPVMAVNVRYSF